MCSEASSAVECRDIVDDGYDNHKKQEGSALFQLTDEQYIRQKVGYVKTPEAEPCQAAAFTSFEGRTEKNEEESTEQAQKQRKMEADLAAEGGSQGMHEPRCKETGAPPKRQSVCKDKSLEFQEAGTRGKSHKQSPGPPGARDDHGQEGSCDEKTGDKPLPV